VKLYWAETARQDLLSIRQYIAADKPAAAKNWIDRLRTRARQALDAPFSGRMLPEFPREEIRELIEGNYRIVYQVSEDHLVVLTVFESHRLLRMDSI
jgi:toxin ParE1/3/4